MNLFVKIRDYDEFPRYLGWSFVSALACCVVSLLTAGPVSFLFLIQWLAVVLVGFYRFGRDGLWLLLGAPLALAWPLFLFVYFRVWPH
jgi:hypothetical protein